jgi:hypothetical protein
MKQYYRIMLGRKSSAAEECFKGNFIGAGFYREEDLSPFLTDDWKDFNKILIPKYLKVNPEKSRMAAGSACGALWTVAKGYMGYVQDELAEKDQIVQGAIVALDDDKRLQRALSVTKNIAFYKYKINFQLIKK